MDPPPLLTPASADDDPVHFSPYNDLKIIFSSLESLKQLREKIIGQRQSCLQLIDRCLSLESSLRTLTPARHSADTLTSLIALQDLLAKCHQLCSKFTGKGWIRTAFDVLWKPNLFNDLHLRPTHLSSTLDFEIAVGPSHEATQLDTKEIISSLREFLQTMGPQAFMSSGQLTDLVKTSLEFTEAAKRQSLPLNPETLILSALRYKASPDEILGVGGFGSVYRGRYGNGKNEVQVAVKVINAIEESERLEISRGVRVMAKAQHANVSTILGYSFTKRLIVMEIANCSLFDILSDKPTSLSESYLQSMEDVLRCFVDILSGVGYLHYHEILHRDMKPHNILLSYNSSTKAVLAKIADFGLTTMSSWTLSKSRNGPVGSMAYLAPELFQMPIYSEKTDIYAVGIIFNEVLTRKPPHPDLCLGAIVTQTLTKPRPFSEWYSQFTFDEELASIVESNERGCLSHDSGMRPTAANLLAIVLRKLSALSEITFQADLQVWVTF
jgi:hypothetical protein